MRETKFRAWDKQAKCMLGGGGMQMNATTGELEHLASVVAMQYTGLKDKNGKEIYEGDIVELYKYQGEALYCVTLTTVVKWSEQGLNYNIYPCHDDAFWKVIGNIYENKELLEVK